MPDTSPALRNPGTVATVTIAVITLLLAMREDT